MAEMPRQLTQAEIDRILFNQRMGMQPTPPSIQNLQRGTSGTVTPIPQNLFQRMAGGAGAAGQFVNQAGTAADIAKLFPGYTGQSQVNIPTGFNFAPKQDPMGGVIPGGLQTQQLNVDQLLKAIKPADVLGLTGAQQAYTDVGMGKAPNPMDVLDIAGLGAVGLGAGKAAAKGTVSAAKYAAPKVGEALDTYAARTGLILPLDAYHGSPYTFDKFDISKVGTGEGAQAYGHGIYFAEAPGVARGYQMALGQKAGEITTINGKPIEQVYEQIYNKANRLPTDKAGVEYQKAEMLEKMMLDTPPNELISYAKDIGADPAVIKWLETDIAPKTKFPGSFYKVDIPDEAVETFLDWDKSLSRQSKVTENLLKNINFVSEKEKIEKFDDALLLALESDKEVKLPKQPVDLTGEQIYRKLVSQFGSPQAASKYLNDNGIQGIRYLDQGSRGAGEGTRNFVVFDPSLVKMLERNNQPVEGLLGK
jgi:hypothetical protein